VDMVFRPKVSARAWSSVDKWTQILAGSLPSSRGRPRVYAAGLMPLDPSASFPDDISYMYAEALAFWSGRQAFYEFRQSPIERTDGLHDTTRVTINKTTGLAWNMAPSQLGQDGYGLAQGSAFAPFNLVPLSIAGTIIDPADTTVPVLPTDPQTGEPLVVPMTWRTLPTAYKVGAALTGAALFSAVVAAISRLRR